jgi:hypothetical protein
MSKTRRSDGRDSFFESPTFSIPGTEPVEGTDLPCYLLADPVEDDPQYTWTDYSRWYKQSLVAMAMFPWMNRFEVMPWPDRVFLPGYHMASGTPGPEDYRRSLLCAFSALEEISKLPAEDPLAQSPRRVGFLVADTLSWQMGGPESADGLRPWINCSAPSERIQFKCTSRAPWRRKFLVGSTR